MTGTTPTGRTRRGAFWRYNAYRVALFVVMGALGYLAGLRGLLLVVAALLVSGVLSYFLLARQRIELARAVTDVVEGRRARSAARTAREDAAADAWREGHDRGGQAPAVQRPAGQPPAGRGRAG